MRLLHIISSSGVFGAENVVLNLGKMIAADGSDSFYLLCLKNHYKPEPDIHFEANRRGISSGVLSCRNKFDIKTVIKIRDFIKSNRIDIVHTHGYKSNLYGLLAARLSGAPIVSTLHGWTGENRKISLYEMLDRWIINRMDHIISVSPSMAAMPNRRKYDKGSDITFIPNAIDESEFNIRSNEKDLRKEFGIGDNVVIGVVGRLSNEKGHVYLLRAVKEILLQTRNIKVLVVGSGPLDYVLKQTAESLGISGNIIFAGSRKDMVPVYRTMDLFVLPSLTEGMPMALLEAMSMVLPVVATKVGAVPQMVAKGEGIVISPGNIDELRDAILLLIKDPVLRKTMGEKARVRVISDYSIGSFCRRYREVYESIYKRN